ncbi:DUF3310 domain-containing protein [Streptomyces sp. NPDC059982]|uniref:DUF3310 domain-containing protein n=1 Tax=unclassified Streptomyces TaxID=2593676 RepID=UPI0036D01058
MPASEMRAFSKGDLVRVRETPYASYRHHVGRTGVIEKRGDLDPASGQTWVVSLSVGTSITLFETEMDHISAHDAVDSPSYYTQGCSNGSEVIDIIESLPFNRGAAIKYLARAGKKNDEIEDLRKAHWYIKRELARKGVTA